MLADEPVASCFCCGRTLPPDELLLRDDFRLICEPCYEAGADVPVPGPVQ